MKWKFGKSLKLWNKETKNLLIPQHTDYRLWPTGLSRCDVGKVAILFCFWRSGLDTLTTRPCERTVYEQESSPPWSGPLPGRSGQAARGEVGMLTGVGDSLTWKIIGFVVSWFLVPGFWFLGFQDSCFLISEFLGFLFSCFLGFLVSKFLSFKDSNILNAFKRCLLHVPKIPCHVFVDRYCSHIQDFKISATDRRILSAPVF